MLTRRLVLAGVLAVLASMTACVRNVAVPRELPVQPPLTIDNIVAKLNSYGEVKTLSAAVTLRFRDLLGATMGKNKEYPAANGRLILARPDFIRVRITAPFVGTAIADMVSNGEKFWLKILYPDDKRKFIMGSNAARYKRVDTPMVSNPELQQAGTLANIRPQHLTDAFLIDSVTFDAATAVYFLDEIKRVERDRRPGASKSAEVVRTYYVLTLLERTGNGAEAHVQRRFWFDRTRGGTPLTSQEIYEDGRPATTVDYLDYTTIEGGRPWPGHVRIERVTDHYLVDIYFERNQVKINPALDVAKVFSPSNDEHLVVVDLDSQPGIMEQGSAR